MSESVIDARNKRQRQAVVSATPQLTFTTISILKLVQSLSITVSLVWRRLHCWAFNKVPAALGSATIYSFSHIVGRLTHFITAGGLSAAPLAIALFSLVHISKNKYIYICIQYLLSSLITSQYV